MEAVTKIEPFEIAVPEEDLRDLSERLARTRWAAPLPGTGWDRGIPVDYVRELADHWATGYDWRRHEARLNELPQFIAEIDGQPIHFIHVRSPEPGATPLVLTHGWPGSVVEFLDVIGPLTDPAAHGGEADIAFDLVIPSLPGFGFSSPLTAPGWDTTKTAQAWARLMHGLGYERYGAQGGDTGAVVSPQIGREDPEAVVGVHVNGLFTFPSGDPKDLEGLTEAEQERLAEMGRNRQTGLGYAMIQSTRPQTIGYGLVDSPAAQLAWIVEKFHQWGDPAVELPAEAIDRDAMLTDVSLYWFTGTAASAADLYYEEAASWGRRNSRFGVPTAVALFPRDTTIRSLAEQQHDIVRWSEFDRGAHFPAMEAPDLLVGDIRAFFAGLR